ncbi:MAG: hypothetical protein AAGG08_14830 [Actinomycetota bacterium]
MSAHQQHPVLFDRGEDPPERIVDQVGEGEFLVVRRGRRVEEDQVGAVQFAESLR